MAIQLKKGNSISLKKEAPGLTRVMLGLGWDMTGVPSRNTLFSFFKPTSTIDLDSSVLCLNGEGKLQSRNDLVYYANLNHNSRAIAHQGDNLTGQGDGDDEQIIVDLTKVPPNLQTLLFVVNIYRGQERGQDFSQIKNAFVRLVDLNTNKEIAYYGLSGETYKKQTSMLMAELTRTESDNWQMKALGEGLSVKSLDDLVAMYR